jgi:3-hydroxymyristoyl/3-hydroxydecanoyl-(acyl carrier protein) dehydratase
MKLRLVDKILGWSPYERITGVKAVSFEEYCLKEPFGDEARLPETLLLESFLQLGNWLILLSSDFARMGMVIRITELRFDGYLLPGQRVRMEVSMSREREDGFEFSGQGHVDGRSVIRGGGCLAVPVPAAQYLDPEGCRVVFSEIYEPEPARAAALDRAPER